MNYYKKSIKTSRIWRNFMNKSEVFQRLFNKEKTLDLEIKNVSIDSKKLEKSDVFVAIRGGNNDFILVKAVVFLGNIPGWTKAIDALSCN